MSQNALRQTLPTNRRTKRRPSQATVHTPHLSLALTRYTSLEGDKMVKQQTSVIRTNCMDCLDRTNVVQSMFARLALTRQLSDVGVFKSTDRIDQFPDFERMYRNRPFPTHSPSPPSGIANR